MEENKVFKDKAQSLESHRAEENKPAAESKRYYFLDMLRGITLISMCIYHVVWDLVYIREVKIAWFKTDAAYIWQQSICCTFILLSGFCWSFGKRRVRRGIIVLGAGALITLATMIFTPQQQIVFGVLTLLGACTLLLIPLESVFNRIPAPMGFLISMLLFLLMKEINNGYLGFGGMKWIGLPESWYEKGLVMTFLGFTDKGFFSANYFSLVPWFFLFTAGYFGWRILTKGGLLDRVPAWINRGKSPLVFLGRHSLLIYLLHQPVVYACIMLL